MTRLPSGTTIGRQPAFNFHHMAKQEYIEKNRAWLQAKASEAGVHALDKGVLYKVIRPGKPDGARPNRGSIVTVHYPAFRLRELIPGWIIALQDMRAGERREVYIPAEQGYGRLNQPGIPGGSTLVFDIELIGVG